LKYKLSRVAVVSVPVLTVLMLNLYAQTSKNTLGIEFVKIPAGEFMMGCSTGDTNCIPDETPRHRVRIAKSFEIGKYEVTQAQWAGVLQSNPSNNKGDNRPVESVSKLDVQEFIAKLNARNDGYRYRLPTEAEWEYAARAGMETPYSGPLDQVAWYATNSEDETHPVGQKRPNAWGLYDVQGNVREWVSDFYSDNYYSESPSTDPTGPTVALRGGPGVGPGVGPGRGFRGGPRGGNPPPAPLPPGATPQQQIDALRQEVQQLRQELQQLRNEVAGGGPPRGGPPLPGRGGPPQGPAIIGPDGQLVDPFDGLPTGLPVARGGGWDQTAAFQRVSARYSYYGPTLRFGDIGFRLVREALTP